MKLLRVYLFSAIAVFFLACSAQSAKEKAAPSLKVADKTRVAVPKSGLGKLYLLSTSMIPQSGAPTSNGLVGRVVFFEQFEDGLDMYETTQGQVVTNDLPARRLLATFPVLDDSGSDVVIDFNAGMRRLGYSGWYNRDEEFNPQVWERSAELPQARVFEVKAKEGVLSIRQAVQARSRESDPDLESRYEIRYFLSPYQTSEFEPREINPEESRYLRFFESPGLLELKSGRLTKKISRFEVSDPVVFYISANTPERIQESIKEGILYWNKVFGKTIVEARVAPEGATAPDPGMNIVQWVPWDSAGFAYADALIDPLTGHTLRAQAYLTSVFDFGGQVRARRLLRTLRAMIDDADEGKDKDKDDDKDGEGQYHAHVGSVGCHFDRIEYAMKLAEGLEDLLSDPNLTDEAVSKIANSYVRDVTAHEVGHILGLRHNFAGSLDATLSPIELDTFMQDYIAGADLSKYAEKTVSNSVMDYSVFNASVFIGWKIKNGNEALPYDTAAIRFGYFQDPSILKEDFCFGSEEETAVYGDVLHFDYGTNPIAANYRNLSASIRNLPNAVIERFISGRAPLDPRDRKPMEAVELEVSSFASWFSEPIKEMLKWFDKSTRSVAIEKEFKYIGDINQDARWEAHWKALNENLKALGGVDQVMFAHLPVELTLDTKGEIEGIEKAPKLDAKALKESLKKLLDSEAYSTFVGLDGKSYTWTEEEKKTILERSSVLFEKLEEEVVLQTLKLFESAPRDLGLAATGNLSDDDCVATLEKRIVELSKSVILKKSEELRIKGKVNKAYVEVSDFEYAFETRMAAATALNDKTGTFEFWSKEAKQTLHADLKSEVEDSLNIGLFKDFDDKMLSRSLREWYLQQQNLLKLLPPAPEQ